MKPKNTTPQVKIVKEIDIERIKTETKKRFTENSSIKNITFRFSEVKKTSFKLSVGCTSKSLVDTSFLNKILEDFKYIEKTFGLKSDFYDGKNTNSHIRLTFNFYFNDLVFHNKERKKDLDEIITQLTDYHFDDQIDGEIQYIGRTQPTLYQYFPDITIMWSGKISKKILKDIELTLIKLITLYDFEVTNRKLRVNRIVYQLKDCQLNS